MEVFKVCPAKYPSVIQKQKMVNAKPATTLLRQYYYHQINDTNGFVVYHQQSKQ